MFSCIFEIITYSCKIFISDPGIMYGTFNYSAKTSQKLIDAEKNRKLILYPLILCNNNYVFLQITNENIFFSP